MSRCRFALLAPLALLAFPGPATARSATLESLWPADDGRAWVYDQRYEALGANPQVLANRTRIVFDGEALAPNGITTQYLHQQILAGTAESPALADRVRDPLLRAVWLARPALRARIEARRDDPPCPEFHPDGAYAVLLGGEFAWRRTASEVAAWRCNLPDTRAWKWLDAALSVGSGFTLPLVPDLASDIVLHATVAAIEPATVPAGTFDACVRVDYVIDYGADACTDAGGQVIGSVRAETRGYVRYAPGVGPVESFERFYPAYEVIGACIGVDPVGAPLTEATLRLVQMPTATPVASWGRLKLTYR